MINISILGSYATKNALELKSFGDYYNISSYTGMSSIISIMEKPILYNVDIIEKVTKLNLNCKFLMTELFKPTLDTLINIKPDYIIMDFYGDARYGIIKLDKSFLLNRIDKFQKHEPFKSYNFGETYNYRNNEQLFLKKWKKSFDKFIFFIKSNLPNTRVIINGIKGNNVVEAVDGEIYTVQEHLNIEKINEIWEKLDLYAVKKYNLYYLNYQKKYSLDPNYTNGIGTSIVKFKKEYFLDFNLGLQKIILNDLATYKPKINRENHSNCIKNSTFLQKNYFWTFWDSRFKIINYDNYNAVTIDTSVSDKSKPQIWSNAVEIEPLASKWYTLSFYVKINDLSKLEKEKRIFCIRTFNNMYERKNSECISSIDLSLEGHEIKEGIDYRYIYSFCPRGKYIKVAPFPFISVDGIEYSRIQLEASKSVSEYKVAANEDYKKLKVI